MNLVSTKRAKLIPGSRIIARSLEVLVLEGSDNSRTRPFEESSSLWRVAANEAVSNCNETGPRVVNTWSRAVNSLAVLIALALHRRACLSMLIFFPPIQIQRFVLISRRVRQDETPRFQICAITYVSPSA